MLTALTVGLIWTILELTPKSARTTVLNYTVIQGHQGQNTSLITNLLKPVMSTSIYDHHHKKIDMPRIPPAILPKPPPVVSVAPTMTLNKVYNIDFI